MGTGCLCPMLSENASTLTPRPAHQQGFFGEDWLSPPRLSACLTVSAISSATATTIFEQKFVSACAAVIVGTRSVWAVIVFCQVLSESVSVCSQQDS